MNQFDKNQIITLDISSPTQIESALLQYQALLSNGLAFNQHQFDVEFKHQTADELRRLQPADAGENLELLQTALNMGQEGGSHHYDDEITEETEVYISEVILFAAALQYPEIKHVVVDTAQAIVAYSRRMNDTDSMWIDDMRVFGIEAVYMLAKTDLQYAYLVGQFFIPYWDDEHATQYEEFLASLLNEHGWHPEVIKAFIWCDNSAFRLGMFTADIYSEELTYQPLGEYLQHNPCQYASFKQLVVERFQAEPVLLARYDQMSEEEPDLSGCNPVVWLYQSLFAHNGFYEDGEGLDAFMQQSFMGSTLENEAYDLQRFIQSQVAGLLVKPAESAVKERVRFQSYLERDRRRFDFNYGTALLKPLILAMPQGQSLWRYIEDGSESMALEALTEIDLLALAKSSAQDMFEHMDDQVCKWEYNNQGLAGEIKSILNLVSGDLLNDEYYQQGATTLATPTDSEESFLKARQQQYLRVIDVFYHALGKRELSKYMRQSLTEDDDEPLLSRQDYYRRYSQLPAPVDEAESTKQDPALSRDIDDLFEQFTDNDELLCNEHFQRVEELLRPSRELCHPRLWPETHMGFVALASYQLYRDFDQQINDDVTQALTDYLNEQNTWQMAVTQILKECYRKDHHYCPEDKGLTEQDIARVHRYFSAEQPEEDQASLMALLEPQLQRDDCCRGNLYLNKFSEYQPGYNLFSDHDEDFQRFTLTAYWLRQLPLPHQAHAERLWQFIVALAPVRIARNVLRAHSDETWSIEFEDKLTELKVQRQLVKAGIDTGIVSAFEMSRNQCQDKCYNQYLDLFKLSSRKSEGLVSKLIALIFGDFARKKARAFQQGLKYINESDKVAFLHHASLKHPKLELDIKHDFERALRIMIKLNINSWEQTLAHELGELCLFIGDGEQVPAELRKEIVADEHTVHDKPCHMDEMEWLKNTILQLRGEQHVLLIADQQIPLDVYQRALPSGRVVIVSEDADPKAILTRIQELQHTATRIEHILAQTLAYLDGECDYDSIATLYAAQIAKERFRPCADEYRLYSLHQFIWMLDKPQRDRFAKLFFNHDYRGLKLIERQHEKAWLLHQLQQGKIDFKQYLELERDEEATEDGMVYLLNWLVEIEINPAHIALFCIKHAHFAACCAFLHHHARGNYGDFQQSLNYLHASRRALLPEILSQAEDGAQLMQPLTQDHSRIVKEALAAHMAD